MVSPTYRRAACYLGQSGRVFADRPAHLGFQSLSIKSIKSLAPLLDRVLVQRVKVAEVSHPHISPILALAR